MRRERETVLSDMDAKKKESKMTEDEIFNAKEELQKIITETNNKLESIFEKKEKEVMG